MRGRLRVTLAWLLVPFFLFFAHPTGRSVAVGFAVTLPGLLLRGWAAGSIDKGETLTTTGPYAYTRNPLYLGSFVIGVGIAIGGGHWGWIVAFALFFTAVYLPTVRREATELRQRFGEPYDRYVSRVPAFALRLTPYRPAPTSRAFSLGRYHRYREWEAALGVAGLLAVLALKASLSG